MKVDFFSKATAKPRKIQFRIHNLTALIMVLFLSVYGPRFWLQAGPPLPLFTIKMENISQNRGALHGTQGRVPTNFILYYIDESVLLGTKPLVDYIRHFIRDPSGVFSVCHLCECHIVQ